jgi:hypothetical protein
MRQERLPFADLPDAREVPAEDWRLDEVTREIGRRGLAEARAALVAAAHRAKARDEIAAKAA